MNPVTVDPGSGHNVAPPPAGGEAPRQGLPRQDRCTATFFGRQCWRCQPSGVTHSRAESQEGVVDGPECRLRRRLARWRTRAEGLPASCCAISTPMPESAW